MEREMNSIANRPQVISGIAKTRSRLRLPASRTGRPGRDIEAILEPLISLANRSANFSNLGFCETTGDNPARVSLPRFLFIGPQGGDAPIRLGLFAGIHGDEPEGVYALLRLLQILDKQPELATGYCLFVYPVCNPTGFEPGTRHNRSDRDLNREFWQNSSEPEVKLLEQELQQHQFHGLISLHTDDTSHGFYGYAHGASLVEALIEPALKAAEHWVPRNSAPVIDGFRAKNGVIREGFQGILSAPPARHPKPFEVILETPADPPTYLKEAALIQSLLTILDEYRKFIAYAPNL